MPVVFAQPAPAGAFNMIAQQGNLPAYLSAYASLANTAQEGYDRQAATQSQERLGYAQMMQDAALRRQALGVQEAEIAIRPQIEMQAAQMHADLQLRNWVSQQRFTMADQQELARQENSLGELMSRLQAGDITDQEFYRAASQRAPLVDALKKKMEYNTNQAQASRMKEEAQWYAARRQTAEQQNAQADAYQAAQLNNKFSYVLDPQKIDEVSGYVADAHPELDRGSKQFQDIVHDEMVSQGYASRYFADKNGKPQLDQAWGQAVEAKKKPSEVTPEQQQRHVEFAIKEANRIAHDQLTTTAKPMSDEEWNKTVKRIISAQQAEAGGSKKEQQAAWRQGAQSDVGEIDKQLGTIKDNPTIPIPPKYKADLEEARKLITKYKSTQEMPKMVYQRYTSLLNRANQFKPQLDKYIAGTPTVVPSDDLRAAVRFMTGR